VARYPQAPERRIAQIRIIRFWIIRFGYAPLWVIPSGVIGERETFPD
jgi:hypothetical protein